MVPHILTAQRLTAVPPAASAAGVTTEHALFR